MRLETKFEKDQKVWHIHEGKAIESKITRIDLTIERDLRISYFLNVGTEKDYKCAIIQEKFCFESREELINSL